MRHIPARTATRVMVESQRDRLRDALNTCTQAPIFTRNLAEQYLTRVKSALKATDMALDASKGLYGKNGWAPGVDDAIRSLMFQHELTVTAKRDVAAAKRMAA